MKKITILFIFLSMFNILNSSALAQSVSNVFSNQKNLLAYDYSFNGNTRDNDSLIPMNHNLISMIGYEKEMLLKAADDVVPVADSIVVESCDENNTWTKDGVYRYSIEEEGNKVTYKIYFLDEVTQEWEGFVWQEYEYDEQGRLVRDVFYEIGDINAKEKSVLYTSKTEHLYNFESGKTVEKISYELDYNASEFVPDQKIIKEFDADDNLLKEEIFSWISYDSNWFWFKEYEYAYDLNGNQTLISEQSWDNYSGVPVGSKKKEFEFDDNGNILTEIDYGWNYVSSDWVLYQKHLYTYLEEGGLNNKVSYRWIKNENIWIQLNKIEYVHDLAGNIIKEKSLFWNDSQNEWVNQDLREFQYDENGNRTYYALSDWSQEVNDWIPSKKMEDSFDASSNQTLRSSYDWDAVENRWIGYEKTEYGFDENGIKLNEIFYSWNRDLNDWIWNRKFVYVNDVYGNSTHLRVYDWDSNENDWLFIEEQLLYIYGYDNNGRIVYTEDLENKSKFEFAFDEAGRIILRKEYYWDETIGDWRLRVIRENRYDNEGRMTLNGNLWSQYGDFYYGSKREWQYSETGQLIRDITYRWDNDAKEWVGSFKNEITYYHDLHKTSLYFVWDSEKNDWQNTLRKTYYYPNEIVLEVFEINLEENLRIFPNPADHSIFVQLPNPTLTARLELFNMNGNKMYSVDIFQGEHIDVSRFTPGVYLYRIIQQQKIYTGKIVKR